MLKAVAEAADISRAQAEKAINALLDNMVTELNMGREVRLAGFGVFKPSYLAPRRSVSRPATSLLSQQYRPAQIHARRQATA